MRKQTTFLVLLSVLLIAACGNRQDQSNTAEEEKQTEATEVNGEREPTDDEIRELGILTYIEDGPYPMFALNVEFPERQMTAAFSLNIESISLDVEGLLALKDKYATIYYLSEIENDLFDIHFDCETLLGEDAPEFEDGLSEITGILTGAERATAGDLPDEITVTDKDGNALNFWYFITDEMAEVNEQEVTVYYYQTSTNTITYLKGSED